METSFFGDLASLSLMRRHQSQLKAQIETLSYEVSAQRVEDISAKVGGDFRPLASVETGIAETEAFLLLTEETSQYAGALQSSLGVVEDTVQRMGPQLARIASELTDFAAETVGEEAKSAFETVVGSLNTRFAGRAIFGGTETDNSPLSDPATMLAELETLVAGMTTAADIVTAVDDWFADGGTFEASHYAGSDTPLAAFALSSQDTVQFDSLASDASFRSVLSSLALGALLESGPLSHSETESLALATTARDRVLSAAAGITDLRGTVGTREARIEEVRTRLANERGALDLARNSIIAADPFEAAGKLQAAQTQLEILFSVTARTAQLSLANYI